MAQNDGIISTTSLAIGVAAASLSREPIILATLAGLVAGTLSMAAGEYVSVSSQVDVETADLKREKTELHRIPEEELIELAEIYKKERVANRFGNASGKRAHPTQCFGSSRQG
ncbi:MAG: VIT1/CCC1 transporter family protein [Cyclobacteriaceae bacterium]|nr:VIT1/CCC1 transporter family protein [Cyclobacteriaceae bacterium]